MDELDFTEEGIEQIDMELFGRCTRQHILYSVNMMRLHRVGELLSQVYSDLSGSNVYGHRSCADKGYDTRSRASVE